MLVAGENASSASRRLAVAPTADEAQSADLLSMEVQNDGGHGVTQLNDRTGD